MYVHFITLQSPRTHLQLGLRHNTMKTSPLALENRIFDSEWVEQIIIVDLVAASLWDGCVSKKQSLYPRWVDGWSNWRSHSLRPMGWVSFNRKVSYAVIFGLEPTVTTLPLDDESTLCLGNSTTGATSNEHLRMHAKWMCDWTKSGNTGPDF